METAFAARQRGNEGQARVCARRAAGILIREYLLHTGATVRSASIMDLVAQIAEVTPLPAGVASILEHLTQRVEAGGILPSGIDLIAETGALKEALGFDQGIWQR